jgi:hypothetical protein
LPLLPTKEDAVQIKLRTEGREDQRADVADDNWVHGAIEAAWAWCNYTGAGKVTAVDLDGARIATVALTIHDE